MLQGALLKRINFIHLCVGVKGDYVYLELCIFNGIADKKTLKMFQNIFGHADDILKLILLLNIVLRMSLSFPLTMHNFSLFLPLSMHKIKVYPLYFCKRNLLDLFIPIKAAKVTNTFKLDKRLPGSF